MFYNTIDLYGIELRREVIKSGSQEDKVLTLFETTLNSGYTGSEVIKMTGIDRVSCRRAMTDLYDAGWLIKTNEYRLGDLGKPNHVYKLRKKTDKLNQYLLDL